MIVYASLPLHSEGGDTAGWHVDAQVLKVGDPQAASVAKNPCACQTIQDVGQPRRHQHRQVGYGQAD